MPVYNQNPTPLEQLRRAQGLTRKELSYLTEISLSTLQAYEQGHRDINLISLKNAVVIADALHCDVRDLMTKEDEETAD